MTGNTWVLLPLACPACGAFAVYVLARLLPARLREVRNGVLALFTTATLAATVVSLLLLAATAQQDDALPTWGHTASGGAFLQAEPGALVIAGVAAGLGMLVALYSGRYLVLDRRYETYYPLLLLLVTGLTGMVLAGDLFNLYLFCELMSVSAYALVSFRRHTDTAIEAGFKYLIMGSVGTAIVLLGISFVYRDAGQLLITPRTGASAGGMWTRVGLACFLVGFGVKSAIVPLHTWLPDAHGRAPSSVSAMLSGIIIQSTFYALLKATLGLGFPARSLGATLIVLSMLNMTLGNGLALVQTNTKRLLAFSTIAQMGYVMFAVGVGLRYDSPKAIQAGIFMLLAHAVMKGLAFLCKGVCHFYRDITDVAQLRGTAWQQPLVAVALGVSLAGLAGVPPLAGFAGKWLILTQALRATGPLAYVGLVVFTLNGAVALGYYVPLIGALFAPPLPQAAQDPRGNEESKREGRIPISAWMGIPLVILGGLVLSIGVYPGPWLEWATGVGAYLLRLGR